MSGFLEQYGVSDTRRERVLKGLIYGTIGLLVVGGLLWYFFRDFREDRQLSGFFDRLKAKDYQSAYRMWGCTPETPCRDYSYEKFVEDWGPNSPHADLSAMKVVTKRSCDASIIRIIDFGKGETVMLQVQRGDRTLSFAPWEFCNPRWQAP